MALIRALAIHVPLDFQSIEEVDRIIKVVDSVLNCAHMLNVRPWTLRIVFPAIANCEELKKYLDNLFSVLRPDIMVGIGVEGNTKGIEDILQLLHMFKKFYSSIRCDSDSCIRRAVDSIYVRPSRNVDINVYTRFALLFGSWIETPYFPATCNISNTLGISASLRYVDLVDRALFENSPQELFSFIENVYRQAEDISRCANIPLLGLDLSLSPWKEESVAGLVEKLMGYKIGLPGTVNAVYSLNKLIEGLIRKLRIRSIGFNEVMLSVAEDSVLNERVREGYMRLRDLINYSMVCVAGLDMVAVPRGVDIHKVAIDMSTVYKIKKRSVAMRIIPTDQEPNSIVKLEDFGITYVASV